MVKGLLFRADGRRGTQSLNLAQAPIVFPELDIVKVMYCFLSFFFFLATVKSVKFNFNKLSNRVSVKT